MARWNPEEERSRWAFGNTAGSGGQLDAALAAACGQDRSASTGAHAGPEAMRTATPTVARLESALDHGKCSV